MQNLHLTPLATSHNSPKVRHELPALGVAGKDPRSPRAPTTAGQRHTTIGRNSRPQLCMGTSKLRVKCFEHAVLVELEQLLFAFIPRTHTQLLAHQLDART